MKSSTLFPQLWPLLPAAVLSVGAATAPSTFQPDAANHAAPFVQTDPARETPVPLHPHRDPNPMIIPRSNAQTETAAEVLLTQISETPYSAREVLRTKLQVAETRFAEKLPEWEARKNALPTKEREEADIIFAQLEEKREILRQKIDGVDHATLETWNSAKSELHIVLQNTIAIYNKLKARFDS